MGAAASHDDDGAPPPPMQSMHRGPMDQTASALHRPVMGPRPSHPATPLVPRHVQQHAPSASVRTTYEEANRAPVQHSGIVANVLTVKKSSIQLVQDASDPHIYLLEFVFDAQVDGFITVYYCARQVIHHQNGKTASKDAPIDKLSYVAKGDRLPGKTPFCKGDKQRYRQNIDKALDIRNFSSSELQNVAANHYPVVIRLEAAYPDDTPVPPEQQIKSQTTFAILVRHNGTYKLQVVGQQVLVNGTIYKILDLYGIGGRDVTASKNKDESYTVDAADECVICLTEPCNTAVEPCNHLCLCEDCARALSSEPDRNRRKCPVCRSELVKLLQFIPAPDPSSSPEDGNTDSTANSTVQSTSTPPTKSATATSSTADNKISATNATSPPGHHVTPTFESSQQNQHAASPSPAMYIHNDLSTLTLDPASRNAP